MDSAPQRANIVLEHVSAMSDFDDGGDEDSWLVVAYLVLDSGMRRRVTLRQCDSRAEASAALDTIWSEVIARKSSVATTA